MHNSFKRLKQDNINNSNIIKYIKGKTTSKKRRKKKSTERHRVVLFFFLGLETLQEFSSSPYRPTKF